MKKISDSTIHRLSKYLHTLETLEKNNIQTISSEKIAKIEQITSANFRKDLSFFGSFGRRGLGYNVSSLKIQIQNILGLNRSWNIALIGIGNLGTALIDYNELKRRDLHVRCIFDKNPQKIGKKIKGLEVLDIKRLPEEIKKQIIQIGIITTPAPAAQHIADMLMDAGIRAILNFAPKTLAAREGAMIRTEDTTTPLQTLTYYLSHTKPATK